MAADSTREQALQAFLAIREKAAKDFPDGLTPEEIENEISEVRREKAEE